MRVCDRHPDRRARETLKLVHEEALFDLCEECKTDVLQFLCEPPAPPVEVAPRRGRPPKEKIPAA